MKVETPPFGVPEPCHRYLLDRCKACTNPISPIVWAGNKLNLVSEKVETSLNKNFSLLPMISPPNQPHSIDKLNQALQRLAVYERLKGN